MGKIAQGKYERELAVANANTAKSDQEVSQALEDLYSANEKLLDGLSAIVGGDDFEDEIDKQAFQQLKNRPKFTPTPKGSGNPRSGPGVV